MNSSANIQTIDKGEAANLIWPQEDLNENEEKKKDLFIKLRVALILGNIEKIKCSIYFKDSIGMKKIETTIWAVCEKNILLKSGIHLPIRRIIDIKI